MTVAETINKKVAFLPLPEQKEILAMVESLEVRNKNGDDTTLPSVQRKHPLTRLAEMAVDMGVSDLADRHDFYAHGKLEDK